MDLNEKRFFKTKYVSVFVYALPIIFFAMCYFVMPITGEDIFQCAATKTNHLGRMANAFRFNARLSDMYAWGVIPYFDYCYSFGFDTLFRVIDVAWASGIVYMMSFVALGRRPGIRLKDAIVFTGLFCAMLLSKWGEVFYVAFSHIHNYLLIGFFSLLFFLMYAKMLWGQDVPPSTKTRIYALTIGFLFGFSSNVTPIAFLITFVFFLAIGAIKLKFKIQWKKCLTSWQAFSVYGVFIAMAIMYGFGTGFSRYINPGYIQLTDYISISDIISNPAENIARLFIHIRKNLETMGLCLILSIVAFFAEVIIYFKKNHRQKGKELLFSFVCLTFVVVHTLIMSQIYISALLRLTVPVYLISVASIAFTLVRIIGFLHVYKVLKYAACAALVILSLVMSYDMVVSKCRYLCKVKSIINTVETSKENVVYISAADNTCQPSDIFGFYQYDFLQDWVLETKTVCGKKVVITK